MKELSLHILDIAKNSVEAEAHLIEIDIFENIKENLLIIKIKDDGCGMSEDFLNDVKNPFKTTRTTRRVGLGIPLLTLAASQCCGDVDIKSKQGEGTTLTATFLYNHIDRAPLGNMAETMKTLIFGSPHIDFLYTHKKKDKSFTLDTRQMRQVLGDVPLDTPEVLSWIEESIKEFFDNIT